MRNSYRGRRGQPSSNFRRGYRPQPNRRSSKQAIDPSRFVKKAAAASVEAYIPANSFDSFGLNPQLSQNITAAGYQQPLPIQDQTIAHAIVGKDVIGLANTGTGKTAAFLIPLINKHLGGKEVTLIMVPTRELAIQVESDFKILAKGTGLYSALCVGGLPIYRQRAELKRNPAFVIGTPGRLKDLLERRDLHLEHCHSLVLDEVDRMVDMGFINDIKKILSQIGSPRQSLFFTATITPAIETIMRGFLREPVKVSVKSGETADNIEQDIVKVEVGENKFDKLCAILNHEHTGKALVFGRTKRGVEKISKELSGRGLRSVSIHGNKSQNQRQRSLLQFRSGEANVMVATDVAARGLDIKEITHVINFDVPETYDDYIHRIGRAGRVGNKGYALTFVD